MGKIRSARQRILLFVALALAFAPGAWAAPKYRVLHAFGTGKDGGGLFSGLILDSNGNLYGVTRGGGGQGCNGTGCGTVFELSPGRDGSWAETILYAFSGKKDGAFPMAGLARDSAGSVYGMTTSAGSGGLGTVFELRRGPGGWNLTVLEDGGGFATLDLDRVGNLYGPLGIGAYGEGAVSELLKGQNWKESWLYSFCPQKPCVDGWGAFAGVTWGPKGVLYGTTVYGGNSPYCGNVGCGVVYELKPQSKGSWKETVLHSFPAFKGDGSKLYYGVTLDKRGNLYGATYQGGSIDCGVIFKLTRKAGGQWEETVLHDFTKLSEGCISNNLAFDKHGNLWGTTESGGNCCGVVFKLALGSKGKWNYSVVHQFNGSDGAQPAAGVIFDKKGNLYGTTQLGGPGGGGVVFEITP